VYLNHFSDTLTALDMTELEEFENLKESAADLGISHGEDVRYRSRNIVMRHQRFHFLEWGSPKDPPLLLLHGSNQSSHSWDLVSLHLCSRYHVFALDQRGHGDSEWNRGAHYSVEDMAMDAESFLRTLEITSPIVIGHSMGGMVTLALANNCPELLKGIVVVDIGPEVNELGARMIREFVGKNFEFDDLDEFLDRVAKYDTYRSRQHIERTIKYNLIRRADGRYVTKNDRRRYANNTKKVESLGAPSLAQLQKLSIAMLVVRGGDSNVLTADAAQRFVSALPNARLETVADCGHNVASQNTLGFLAAITPFLTEIQDSGSRT
jgi:pimeloyl-ACP methyl ester carboxylesterase|tara:strand:- start:420 stop:1385 length:966 start_codon:yes stop_codon:yes gene_type:complete